MANMSRQTGVVASAAALIAIGVAWYFLAPGNVVPSAALFKANDMQVVAAGQRIYAETCAACHGANLEGEDNWQTRDADGYLPAPPHDETGHTWHHADLLLFDLTKFGLQKFAGEDYQSKMPAYEDVLSDEEIIAVLSYIKSRWPEDVRERHDQINATADKG